MEVALVGVFGVVVGGVIGLAAQLLTSRSAARQKWAETRRVVYSEFIESISISRRQLDDVARARALQETVPTSAAVDARELHLQAVASWNRVRLISQSGKVQDAARELSVRIKELRDLLEASTTPLIETLDAINQAYDDNRNAFMAAAQHEIGLTPHP